MSSAHKTMSKETIKKVLFLQMHKVRLSEWELGLLNDRFTAIKTYSVRAVATQKQIFQLGKMHEKVKLEIKLERL